MEHTTDEKTWAMWCHFSAFSAMVGVPMGNILGPLLLWQVKRADSPFIEQHGKEALNFQLSLMLYTVIAALVFFFFVLTTMAGVLLKAGSNEQPGFLLPFWIASGAIGPFVVFLIFPLLAIIFTLIAGLRAHNGELYRYPFAIRFVR